MGRPSDQSAQMRLYDRRNQRLYLNASERERFIAAAWAAPGEVRTFCLTLAYTGCRISEAIELTPAAVQLSSRLIGFRTLKKRQAHVVREVPIPSMLARELDRVHTISALPGSRQPLWPHRGRPVYRSLAYRWVKATMAEAGIEGAQAMPKGLRHGYGVHAIRAGVQLHMLSKWMGHASLKTTAIYATAVGLEELEIADRMWAGEDESAVER